MSNPLEEFAAAVDQLDHDAVEDLSRRIAVTEAHYAAKDLALFIQEIASRIMLKRVEREAGLTSGTRKG